MSDDKAFERAVEGLTTRDFSAAADFIHTIGNTRMINGTGETLLHKMCYRGRADLVPLLVKQEGIDVNQPDSQGYTPLHEAARAGRAETIVALLALGANIDRQTTGGKTPLDMAREHGNGGECVTLLTAAADKPRWHVTGEDEIAHVSTKAGIGYKLTEIFNFSSQTYLLITRNIPSGTETSNLRTFDEIADTPMVAQAEKAFTEMGGKLPESYDGSRLNKNTIRKPLSGRRFAG